MPVTDAIRRELLKAVKDGQSYYAIAKATGMRIQVLTRFATGERKQIRGDTIDKLAEYFGLALRPKVPIKRAKP